MVIRHILASRADDGRIYLFDSTDNFSASYVDGHWVDGRVFQFWETDEFFYDITDDGEVFQLIAEARSALSPPASKQPKPKTA